MLILVKRLTKLSEVLDDFCYQGSIVNNLSVNTNKVKATTPPPQNNSRLGGSLIMALG